MTVTSEKQFPDVEAVLLNLLETVAPTYTATPEPLNPPIIRVIRVGGGVDRHGVTDQARVEVACFGTERDASRQLNEDARRLLLNTQATSVDGIFIDRIREDTAPVQIPYEAPDVRRVVSNYVVSVRRQ